MYIRRHTRYDPEEIVGLHIDLFYGKIREVDNNTMDDFYDTLRYCIIQGCYRNFDFAKYCEKNYILGDDEYITTIKTNYLLNGENTDTEKLDLYKVLPRLYNIKEENLEKLTKHENLNEITVYLTTLYKNEELFNRIKEPRLYNHTKILIQYYDCPNYLNEKFEKFKSKRIKFFPIYIDTEYSANDVLYIDIFAQRINYDNVFSVYCETEEGPLINLTKIKNLEMYILDETDLQEKYTNKLQIIDNIKCAKYAQKEKKYKNLYCSMMLYIDPDHAYNVIEEDKPFIMYINKKYDPRWLRSYLGDGIIWSVIYSIAKSNIIIDSSCLEYIEKMGYIEYNCYVACVQTKHFVNLNTLRSLYEKYKKCYKILDFENQKYIKEEVVLDLQKTYEFDVNDYILE